MEVKLRKKYDDLLGKWLEYDGKLLKIATDPFKTQQELGYGENSKKKKIRAHVSDLWLREIEVEKKAWFSFTITTQETVPVRGHSGLGHKFACGLGFEDVKTVIKVLKEHTRVWTDEEIEEKMVWR